MTDGNQPDIPKVREMYDLVMDEDVNPLRELQKPRRLQLMTVLSWMWTTIFCASFGVWYMFDELVVAHVAVILGIGITGLVFQSARRGAGETTTAG